MRKEGLVAWTRCRELSLGTVTDFLLSQATVQQCMAMTIPPLLKILFLEVIFFSVRI